MTTSNPATPAQAANPGGNEQGAGTPPANSSTPPQEGAQGNQQGAVTISAEEYRILTRDHARQQAFEKRKGFTRSRNNPSTPPATGAAGDDPELVEALHREQDARIEAERKALKAEVSVGVGSILAKSEYAKLPQSTKNLILKNPHMLSEADNVEDALLDIEDFVREEVAGLSAPGNSGNQAGGNSQPNQPVGHETPPTVGAGNPAPVNSGVLEDTSKLTGVARSRAILRNALKQKGFKNS